MTENANGGRREAQEERFDLLPYEGLAAAARVLARGEDRYGRWDRDPSKPNWAAQDLASHQSSASHAMKHLALYIAGDETEDHLGSAIANLLILAYFRDNPDSPYVGLAYPEILSGGYKGAEAEAETQPEAADASNFFRSLVGAFSADSEDQERGEGT